MGYQRYNNHTVTAVTAASSGANIPLDAHGGFCSFASTAANNVIRLPKNTEAPIGWKTEAWTAAACELRLSTSDTAGTINDVNCANSTEAALPTTNLFRITKVASATWILESVDEGGDDIAGIVPD